MLNQLQTLKNLHDAFPELSIDDLFKILDCFVEDYQLPAPNHYAVRTVPLNNISYERTTSKPDFTTSTTGDYLCCEPKRK